VSDQLTLGPLIFDRLNGVEVGVSGPEEYMGLLDNFYDRTWQELEKFVSVINGAVALVEGLADQQAMQDDSYRPALEELKRALAGETLVPDEDDDIGF